MIDSSSMSLFSTLSGESTGTSFEGAVLAWLTF